MKLYGRLPRVSSLAALYLEMNNTVSSYIADGWSAREFGMGIGRNKVPSVVPETRSHAGSTGDGRRELLSSLPLTRFVGSARAACTSLTKIRWLRVSHLNEAGEGKPCWACVAPTARLRFVTAKMELEVARERKGGNEGLGLRRIEDPPLAKAR